MKRFIIIATVVIFGLFLVLPVMAGSLEDEAVHKCKEAAEMINKMGLDAAKSEINKKDGKFVTPNTYVFLMNTKGEMLGHPMKASLIGQNMMASKDSNGKEFFKEFVQVATAKGSGWIDYMWPKPNEEKPSQKVSYVLKVKEDLIVGAGYYK